MPEGSLTQYFGDELVERIAGMFRSVDVEFDVDAFTSSVSPLTAKKLMERVDAIGRGLGAVLPSEAESAWDIMRRVLPEPLGPEGQVFNDGYWMLPLAAYWTHYHLDHPETAVAALEELTQRGTAEFAVRRFIEARPTEILAVIRRWVESESFHVRRLASEGTRLVLPWSGRLAVDAEHSLNYFETVRALAVDKSAYVRRSVGNHARDLRRIDSAVVDEWLDNAEVPADVRKLAAPRPPRKRRA